MDDKKVLDRSIYKEARKQTVETIGDFINHVMSDYCINYDTVCFAVAASALAALYAADNHSNGGITGFQASYIMFEIIRQMNYTGNKCGLRIINYDDMLYPQYKYKFDKTITSDIFLSLQETAAEKIKEDGERAHPEVIKHWKSIVDGSAPFGYTVKE